MAEKNPFDQFDANPFDQFDAPAAPRDDSMLGQLDRASGQTLRTAGKAGFLGLTGLAGLVADAGVNAAYGAKKLASKTGVVDPPDPANYYKSDTYFPVTAGLTGLANRAADAAGLPDASNKAQEYVMGAGEAAGSSLTGAGVARIGAQAAQGVGGFLARFLAAEPAIGAAASATGATASRAVEDVGGDALPAWAPAAIGTVAGVGTGSAISGARSFGGYVPGFGRVSSTSRAGQEAIANTITQRIATNPEAAARNLRGQNVIEGAPDYVAPGYSELSTNAAQDPGLATAKQYFRDAAGGDIATRAQSNNVALTRAFERQGAGEGAEARVRAQANAGTADLNEFGLTAAGAHNNPDPIEISPFMEQLARQSDPMTPGTTASGRAASREIRGHLRTVSQAEDVLDLDGNVVGQRFDISPERLQSVRQDISESLAPARPGAAPALPSVVAGRGAAGRAIGSVDELLADNTNPIIGPQGRELSYPDYLARQRGLRTEADERGFMRALMEDAAPNTNPVTGAQEFKAPRLARLFNERNMNRAIPGARNNMSIARLTPGRQAFLRDAEELGQLANFSNTAGTATAGSSTAKNLMTEGGISNIIREGRAPYEKVLDSVSRTPVLGSVGRIAGYLWRRAQGEEASDAASGIRSRLGEFETNRDAAIGMLTGRQLPERGFGISARRQSVRTARYGEQSFLAGTMGAEDAKRRRRAAYAQ